MAGAVGELQVGSNIGFKTHWWFTANAQCLDANMTFSGTSSKSVFNRMISDNVKFFSTSAFSYNKNINISDASNLQL